MRKKRMGGGSHLVPKRTYPNFLRFINNTGNNDPKRIIVAAKSVGTDSDADLFWRDLVLQAGQTFVVNFNRALYMTASQGEEVFPMIRVTPGRKYHISGGELADNGAASGGSAVDFQNDTGSGVLVTLYKDARVFAEITVSSSSTYSFQYQSRLWMGAFDGLEDELDFSDINTEMSLLGIKSADVSITGSSEPYSLSLTNIVS
jgi:hypothetical protein